MCVCVCVCVCIIQSLKNETLPYMTTRMNPEDIMLNEINQTQKDKFHMISLICKILHTHTHTHTQIHREHNGSCQRWGLGNKQNVYR